jgi:hypothetical protein
MVCDAELLNLVENGHCLPLRFSFKVERLRGCTAEIKIHMALFMSDLDDIRDQPVANGRLNESDYQRQVLC